MPSKMILFRNREHCQRLRALPFEELITLLDKDDLEHLMREDHDDTVFRDGNEWEEFLCSTSNYARLRSRTELHAIRVPDSYRNFGDNDQFLIDLKIAIEQRRFGPSYEKLKRAVLDACPVRVVTARGQSPGLFKHALQMLIEETFSDEEKLRLFEAVQKKGYESIEAYVADQRYYPVSSMEFKTEFGIHRPETRVSTEQAKIMALTHAVKEIVDKFYVSHDDSDGDFLLSFGFSDDDPRNVRAVERLFEEELSLAYPRIKFALYDTSDPRSTKKTIHSPLRP